MGRCEPNNSPRRYPAKQLVHDMTSLINKSLSDGTKRSYDRCLLAYKTFVIQNKLSLSLPSNPMYIALFMTYLHNQNKSLSTIRLHLSAISFVHSSLGINDVGSSFLYATRYKSVRSVT